MKLIPEKAKYKNVRTKKMCRVDKVVGEYVHVVYVRSGMRSMYLVSDFVRCFTRTE